MAIKFGKYLMEDCVCLATPDHEEVLGTRWRPQQPVAIRDFAAFIIQTTVLAAQINGHTLPFPLRLTEAQLRAANMDLGARMAQLFT